MALGDVFLQEIFPNLAFEPYHFELRAFDSELVGDFQTFDRISQWLELLKRKDEEESSMPIWLFLGHIFYLENFPFITTRSNFSIFFMVHGCLSKARQLPRKSTRGTEF